MADISESKIKVHIYSEKATFFFEISTVDLSYVLPIKSTMEILQNFVAFSEYMNFKKQTNSLSWKQKIVVPELSVNCHKETNL
jgi:hypothetical protein